MVYLQINLKISESDRTAAASVYAAYKQPFLEQAPGALSKTLLIRNEDVQVLHGFNTASDASAYLSSELFNRDVVGALSPLLLDPPDVRIYTEA
jgi:hypothetical protein